MYVRLRVCNFQLRILDVTHPHTRALQALLTSGNTHRALPKRWCFWHERAENKRSVSNETNQR